MEEAYSEKASLRSSQQSLEEKVKDLLDQLEEKKDEINKKQKVIQDTQTSKAKELMKKDEASVSWVEP